MYRSSDGRPWTVTFDSPGSLLRVDPELEKSGALLPEHEVRIVFTSGEESHSAEYTALARLEDLSENEMEEWFEAARRQQGL